MDSNSIVASTINPFTKAFLKVYTVWINVCEQGKFKFAGPEWWYLSKLSSIYSSRIRWAVALRQEYNNAKARNDDDYEEATTPLNELASDDRTKTALESIRSSTNQPFIDAWRAFEDVRAIADAQWQELCDLVDKDKDNRPDPGQRQRKH